jgi:hypothetical protein
VLVLAPGERTRVVAVEPTTAAHADVNAVGTGSVVAAVGTDMAAAVVAAMAAVVVAAVAVAGDNDEIAIVAADAEVADTGCPGHLEGGKAGTPKEGLPHTCTLQQAPVGRDHTAVFDGPENDDAVAADVAVGINRDRP